MISRSGIRWLNVAAVILFAIGFLIGVISPTDVSTYEARIAHTIALWLMAIAVAVLAGSIILGAVSERQRRGK